MERGRWSMEERLSELRVLDNQELIKDIKMEELS